MNTIETFKVISVSKNTNSFGLHGVIIVNKRGITYEIGVGSLYLPKKDQELKISMQKDQLLSIEGISYEIPSRKNNAPQSVINEIFK